MSHTNQQHLFLSNVSFQSEIQFLSFPSVCKYHSSITHSSYFSHGITAKYNIDTFSLALQKFFDILCCKGAWFLTLELTAIMSWWAGNNVIQHLLSPYPLNANNIRNKPYGIYKRKQSSLLSLPWPCSKEIHYQLLMFLVRHKEHAI